MKITINHILDKVIILNLFLLSGSILSVGFSIYTFIFSLLIILLSLAINRMQIMDEIRAYLFFSFIILTFLLLNFSFTESGNYSEYIYFYFRLLFGGLTYLALSKRNTLILPNIYSILKILMILSLIGFALSHFISGNILVFSNGYSCTSILYFQFFMATERFIGIDFIRNQGIFWEPGVLGVYANLFLFLTLFSKRNIKDALLASITIITTFSTTGLLILVVQWAIYLKESQHIKLSLFKLFFGLLLLISLSLMMYTSLNNKIKISDTHPISSFPVRTYELFLGSKLAFTNPLSGIGLNKEVLFFEIDKILSNKTSAFHNFFRNRGISNSFISLFYIFGIPWAIIVLYMIYKQSIVRNNKLLFLIIVILMVSNEPLLYTPFFIFIFYSGFKFVMRRYTFSWNPGSHNESIDLTRVKSIS